jgi:hypothetical protein
MQNKIKPTVINWADENALNDVEGLQGIYSIYYKVPAPLLPRNIYGAAFNPNVNNIEFKNARNHKAGLEYNIAINIEKENEIAYEPNTELYPPAAEIANHFTQPLYIGMSADCLRTRIMRHKLDINKFISNLATYYSSYEESNGGVSEYLEYINNEYRSDTKNIQTRFKNFGRNLERFYFEQKNETFMLEEHLFYFKVFPLSKEYTISQIEEIEKILIKTFHPLTNIKYY